MRKQFGQFGQFIGQFQAIQHKLADRLIGLDGTRLALEQAASERARGERQWKLFASAAIAFAGPALCGLIVQVHRALRAIGYAEEHEVPRHFRRVHADLIRFGGAPRARSDLSDALLGAADGCWPPGAWRWSCARGSRRSTGAAIAMWRAAWRHRSRWPACSTRGARRVRPMPRRASSSGSGEVEGRAR